MIHSTTFEYFKNIHYFPIFQPLLELPSHKKMLTFVFKFARFFFVRWLHALLHLLLLPTLLINWFYDKCKKLFNNKWNMLFWLHLMYNRYMAIVRNRSYKKFFSKMSCVGWVIFIWAWPNVLMLPTLFGDWSGLR